MPEVADSEKDRLEALNSLNVFRLTSESYKNIVRVTSSVFGVPIASIAFVDLNEVYFQSAVGISVPSVPRALSFTDLLVKERGFVAVEDASTTPDFANNYLVKNLGVRFWAGVPLTTPEGYVIGGLFIADTRPHAFSDLQRAVLTDLSKWALDELLKSKLYLEERKVRQDLMMRNRELAGEKARSEAMLADIGDGVIGINDKGEITFVNAQVEVMTGFAKEDLLGKLLIQTIVMQDAQGGVVQAADRPIRQAIFYKKKVQSRAFSYICKNGKKFAAAITATPIVVFDQTVGGVVVFRDITREMEVDRMKTEFISLASHQLRTPLSAMKWFGEILLDGDAGKLTDEQHEIVTNIYKSNERMIDLVNTLLNISRIESGRIVIEPRPTDLKKLVDEVVLEVTQKLKKKKHKLAISIHGKLPLVSLDPKLVRHVYLNLLTNAVKYTPEGGDIVIIISRSGDQIISQVSDNGLGIPANQQDKVFKKFFRAENVAKVETEGTGLGLYLAKAIVESSGGKIWFKSEEGKGTTFWFSLPLNAVKKEGVVSIDS